MAKGFNKRSISPRTFRRPKKTREEMGRQREAALSLSHTAARRAATRGTSMQDLIKSKSWFIVAWESPSLPAALSWRSLILVCQMRIFHFFLSHRLLFQSLICTAFPLPRCFVQSAFVSDSFWARVVKRHFLLMCGFIKVKIYQVQYCTFCFLSPH